MKFALKKILGPNFTSKVREWFPSEVQKKSELRETERKSAFYSLFIKRDEICFGVGANIGNRIKPLLLIGAKVVAIEPQEKCYRFLNRKYGKKIILVRKGLGESESIKKFHLSDDSTISSFPDEWINAVKQTHRFKEKKWNKEVLVEMTTADKLIEKYGKPSFIKIDVEGYELEVLKGLTFPVKMVSFEYTVPEQPDRAIMCINQIEKSNKNIECNYSIG
ncbi:MAG: methyltransferase, FkbM family [Mucilaginibacter sp.]|nr:methyltransferase, FkbM family [Mucilaginibacter sp.]